MLAGVAFDALPAQAQDERAADGLRLTLSSQTVWQGAYGWCSLSAEIELDRGGLSFRCGGAGPFGRHLPVQAGEANAAER